MADGAGELCTELGCLPLAIEQAGAYLAETAISPRAYLTLLAEYPAAMFESVAVTGDPGRTIARIWRVTLDRLADESLAGQIQRILAWSAPDPIPSTLLNPLARPPGPAPGHRRLAASSMLAADDMTIIVHRLVQAVARTPDAADPQRAPTRIDEARIQATILLYGAIPLPGTIPLRGRPGGSCCRTSTHSPATHPLARIPPQWLAFSIKPGCSSMTKAPLPVRSGSSTAPSPASLGCWVMSTGNAGLPQQPRRRVPGCGGSGPGHPAMRAGPHRLRPGAGRGPPDVGTGARQPRRSASTTRVEGAALHDASATSHER